MGGTWVPGPQQAAAECGRVECHDCYFDKTFLNGVDGPGCGCRDGYAGTVWYASYAVNPAVCTTDSTVLVGGWDGPEKYGGSSGSLSWKCYKAPCTISNSNNKSGPDCACAEGYFGTLTWKGRAPGCACAREGPSCSCAGSWEGACTPKQVQLSGDTGYQPTGVICMLLMVLVCSSAKMGMLIAHSRRTISHQTPLLG